MNRPGQTARWSLRSRLSRVLVTTALLPALLFGAALLWNQWAHDRGDLFLRLGSNAQMSANAIDDFLQGELAGVELLAGSGDLQAADAGQQLERLLRAYPAMAVARIVDADGRVLFARTAADQVAETDAVVATTRDWFARPRASGRAQVSAVYPAPGGEARVAVSAPLVRDGRFDGVVQASIPVRAFTALRSRNLRLRGFELLLLDADGRVIHAGDGLRWRALESIGDTGVRVRRAASPPGQPGPTATLDQVMRGGGAAYVNAVAMRSGWVLAVVAPARRLQAPAWPRFVLMLALLAATTLGVLWALWQQRRLLRNSIGYLLASLRGYALGGRLDAAPAPDLPEELQPLSAGIADLTTRLNDAYGELRGVIDQREEVIRERTRELSEAVSKLDRLSRTDALTGCLNYRGFQEEALRLWQAAADRGAAFAVLAIDIDHFKAYNDHYGHLHGDGALKRFAGAVRSALFHADDVLARQGGEEFAVLLPDTTPEQARAVAARIRERLHEADIAHLGAPGGRMTASIGIAAMAAGEQVPLGTLLTRADAALYRAKSAGRDRAEV